MKRNPNPIIKLLPLLLLASCGGAGKNSTFDVVDMAGLDMAVAEAPDMAGNPPAPQLGAQIDRMGRPTVNVAITNPFDLDLSMAHPGATGRDVTRDLYNQDADPTKWQANWTRILETNLAIYDGVDGTCGNQLLADTNKNDASRYAIFAAVLADDQLYVDTTQTVCNFYLAVEFNVAAQASLHDCGGRTPLEPVVAETYTFAAVGPTGYNNGTFAVTDGVSQDADGTASLTTFPFLAAPN